MLKNWVTFLVLIGLLAGCAGKKKPQAIDGYAGRFILGYGFSIDAVYDPRLDKLVPDYRLLTVAIRNTSLQVIQMDASRDQWVLVNRDGKRIKAFNTLREKDNRRWKKIPEKVRNLVDYPEVVPISYTVTFNIFFPKSADLSDFKEIRYTNSPSGSLFRIHKDD